MITYLGYEDLNPKYNAYNVYVCYPVTKDNASGSAVATIYVKPEVFEMNFKDVTFGTVLPFNVSYTFMNFKQPINGQYKAILSL